MLARKLPKWQKRKEHTTRSYFLRVFCVIVCCNRKSLGLNSKSGTTWNHWLFKSEPQDFLYWSLQAVCSTRKSERNTRQWRKIKNELCFMPQTLIINSNIRDSKNRRKENEVWVMTLLLGIPFSVLSPFLEDAEKLGWHWMSVMNPEASSQTGLLDV